MNRSLWTILLIFLVPLVAYFGLSKYKMADLPSYASSNAPEVIKFSSPMCYECQELEKIFDEVFPKYNRVVNLKKVDVTQKGKDIKDLIKKYDVNLVPTTVFKNTKGDTVRRIEGTMPSSDLEFYLKEIQNG